jgi:hypothetical protein
MRKLRLTLAVALTLPLLVSLAQAQFGIPIIYDATLDRSAGTLTLTGVNFGPSPTVTLGGVLPLTVLNSSATKIVASVPAALAPGSYLLFVKFSNFTVSLFEATIGAVGPQGPPGAPGTPGPPGAPGASGAPGANGISVTVAAVSSGDAHCPTGGALVTGASGSTYVCNGAQGPAGPIGPIQTQIFTTTSPTSFQVPSGVNSVTVEAWGGGGGATPNANGGAGAHINALSPVNAGDTFTITVGSGGAAGDAANAGGNGSLTTVARNGFNLFTLEGGSGGGVSAGTDGADGGAGITEPGGGFVNLQISRGVDSLSRFAGTPGAGGDAGLPPVFQKGKDGLVIIHLASTN